MKSILIFCIILPTCSLPALDFREKFGKLNAEGAEVGAFVVKGIEDFIIGSGENALETTGEFSVLTGIFTSFKDAENPKKKLRCVTSGSILRIPGINDFEVNNEGIFLAIAYRSDAKDKFTREQYRIELLEKMDVSEEENIEQRISEIKKIALRLDRLLNEDVESEERLVELSNIAAAEGSWFLAGVALMEINELIERHWYDKQIKLKIWNKFAAVLESDDYIPWHISSAMIRILVDTGHPNAEPLIAKSILESYRSYDRFHGLGGIGFAEDLSGSPTVREKVVKLAKETQNAEELDAVFTYIIGAEYPGMFRDMEEIWESRSREEKMNWGRYLLKKADKSWEHIDSEEKKDFLEVIGGFLGQ